MTESKTCTRCGEVKPLNEYGVQKNVKDGRKSRCKACLAELSRQYNANNPEKRRESERSWRDRNPNKVKAMAKRSRTIHADSYRDRLRKWKAENPDRVSANTLRRRANKLSLRSDYHAWQRKLIIELFGGCALTGRSDNVHMDHFIALSTGCGGTWVGNMIPLDAELNISKGSRNPFEWIRERTDIDLTRFWFVVDILASLNGLTREEYVLYVYLCYGGEYGA